MKQLVPDYIEQAALYPPGRPLEEARRELGLDRIIKLNANENSLGPSPKAVQAIRKAAASVHLYPDNSAYYLRDTIARAMNVSTDQIIFGNGSNELVQFILMTFLLPGEEIITAKPTFLLYRIMGRALGGMVQEVKLFNNRYNLQQMEELVTDKTKIVFISDPNNPTGTIVPGSQLRAFIETVCRRDILVVVDNAYAEYATDPEFADLADYVRQEYPVILLRTFSKAYGLAGLRIGYGCAPSRLVSYMERIREPFNVNTLALKAALAAVADHDHLNKTLRNNERGRNYIYKQLSRIGLSYVPSETNFIMIHTGPRTADVVSALLERGVMVRPLDSFGLEQYVRVTVGRPYHNREFIRALEDSLQNV